MGLIQITQNSGNESIQVSAGDTIRLQLPESPTTGFRWEIKAYDKDNLKLMKDEFILNAPTGIGGGGIRIFEFIVNKKTQGAIQLENKQNWTNVTEKSLEVQYS